MFVAFVGVCVCAIYDCTCIYVPITQCTSIYVTDTSCWSLILPKHNPSAINQHSLLQISTKHESSKYHSLYLIVVTHHQPAIISMRRNAYGNKVDLSGHVAFLCAWCRWRSQCVISSGKTQRFHGKKTCLIWIHGPVTHNLVKIGCWNLLKATALGGLERIFFILQSPSHKYATGFTEMHVGMISAMTFDLWPFTCARLQH